MGKKTVSSKGRVADGEAVKIAAIIGPPVDLSKYATCREIAEQLGLTLNQAKWRLARAVERGSVEVVRYLHKNYYKVADLIGVNGVSRCKHGQ